MSIWDHIKKSEPSPVPNQVEVSTDRKTVRLTWLQGKTTELTARTLRQICPCAECVDEWTNKRTLDPKSVPVDIRIEESRQVGNYALGLRFSDGHHTGIYHFKFLKAAAEKTA